jgi:deoxyribodipyrimidine photolyase-related protein
MPESPAVAPDGSGATLGRPGGSAAPADVRSEFRGLDAEPVGARKTVLKEQLVLILGDQLTPDISSLRGLDPARTVILMAEVAAEAEYVGHHRKKLAFLFAAMRHFAAELRAAGWEVDYVRLGDAGNSGSFAGEIERARRRRGNLPLRVTEAGEHRVAEILRGIPDAAILPHERFFMQAAEFAQWAEGRSQLRMEYFYRMMRRRTGLLMDGDEPLGGKWNFDSDNRKAAVRDLMMTQPLRFEPDAVTADVLAMVAKRFPDNFGALEPFWFAVTRRDAEAAFDDFVNSRLAQFGDYQDAMLSGEKFLYHAVIAQYLNIGLLDARRLCWTVDAAHRAGKVPINAAEGLVRQILGWREYVRGIYWWRMPGYASENVLGAARPLPAFYWTGDTDMACVAACVTQTREEAYAHHIQRLMVTGNFALLAGVDPAEVHRWYLAVYADAYEWVEMPNTLGMSQFADGGLLASKPYAASGAYISRMSDYCRDCRYEVKRRTGPEACPFNFLYWDFVARHETMLRSNPRTRMAADTWGRFSDGEQKRIRASAQSFLTALS